MHCKNSKRCCTLCKGILGRTPALPLLRPHGMLLLSSQIDIAILRLQVQMVLAQMQLGDCPHPCGKPVWCHTTEPGEDRAPWSITAICCNSQSVQACYDYVQWLLKNNNTENGPEADGEACAFHNDSVNYSCISCIFLPCLNFLKSILSQ